MIGVLLALTVLASFFVANRTSITRSPTSRVPQDVGATDASDYQKPILHGGRLQFYWQVWQLLHCHPRVVQILRFGYQIIPQSNPPKSVLPTIHSRYSKLEKHHFLTDCVSAMLKKGAIYPLKVCTTLGFCSRLFLVPKPRKKWHPVIDLSVLSSFLHVPTFKMETAEIIRNLVTKGEWLVSIDLKDAYFHVPIHPDSHHLLRFHVDKRTYQFKALPFGLVTAPLEFTRIVKEVKLVLQSCGIRVHQCLDDWLLRANTRHQCQLQTKELIHVVLELGFVINLEKSELKPTQKNRLSGLPFRFDTGKSLSDRKEVESSRKVCSGHGDRITNNPKVAYVPDRCTSIPRKDNTNGSVTYALFPMVPKNKLAVSPVSRPEDSCFKPSKKASSVVERSKKSKNELFFTSTGTQYPYFHRCVKSGLGSSFRKHDSQWQLDRSRKITSYQCPRVKGSVSGLKKLSKQNSRQKGSDSNRQRHCSQLSEQTRGNTLLGHVSPGLAHLGLLQSSKHTHKSQTHSGLPQCHSRQSLQEGQNNSNRMVSSSSNIQPNLQSLAQTNGGHVCHQIESQTTNLCLTSPRCKCYEHRCIEHLGGSGRLCLLSCSSHTKSHTENEHLQVQDDSSTRVAQNALVLGSSESVNQTPITTTSLASSVKTTIQSEVPSESHVSESACLAPRHHSESLESLSEQVADRIKAPQRPSSRRLYESRWSILELWCQQNKVVSAEPSISDIAEFLNHLFTVKNLKPAIIAGYRTAIADHLGLLVRK